MAPVIWGLNLGDMKWSAFKSSNMFGNRDFHMRRTKFVVYQLAMIFMVCSESVGTAALSDYVDQQDEIERLHSSATVHNDDFVGVASYNIFVGVAVATIFGAGFFFDLFFPDRYEPRNIRWAWRLSALFVTLCTLGDAIAFTVVVFTSNSYILADSADAEAIALSKISPPLSYKHNGRVIASFVLLWIGLVSTIAACVVLWMFYDYVDKNGTAKSRSTRRREKREKARGPNEPVSP